MSNEPQPIVVDIGAAAAMLEASPELAAMMNEMIGGPALVAAQAEIERLRDALAQIQTVCDDNLNAANADMRLSLKFVQGVAAKAIANPNN